MSRKGNGQATRERPEAQADKLKEAAALLEADRQAREKQFLVELQSLCQKYQCDLIPTFQVKAN